MGSQVRQNLDPRIFIFMYPFLLALGLSQEALRIIL